MADEPHDRSKPPPIIEGSIQHKVGSDFFREMIERQLGEELYKATQVEPSPPPLAMPLPSPPGPQTAALPRPPAARSATPIQPMKPLKR